MYIFSERGDQELSKTVSIMFIRHFWTILQYLKVRGVFSGIEYFKIKKNVKSLGPRVGYEGINHFEIFPKIYIKKT